ncbi:MAG TPA: glycosyltransferase family 9 protein [Nitrospiraceae bacterium]|nr:glycosyltransferase family 9 protein [Nitrospiraceae bacterium]
MKKQVLIINVTRMGDLIQTGPLLSRLRQEWPDVAIDLVVDRSFAPTAALLTGLRQVISCDFTRLLDDCRTQSKSLVTLMQEMTTGAAPLRDARYNRIVNLTFNRQTGLLASYIGAPDLRGITAGPDGNPIVHNPWLSYFTDLHRHRRFNRFNLVDLYAMGGSGPGTFSPLSVTVPADGRDWADEFLCSQTTTVRQWIAVQVGASDVMKAWRPEYFGRTLAVLSRHPGLGFVLIGTAAESESIEQAKATYRAGGGTAPMLDASGRTTLHQLVGLLSRCRLLLTNDTGPMHIAVGVGTPVIDLSVGHVDHHETGPYGPGHWVIQPDLACSPCGFDQICAHHACKDRLIPEEVAKLCLHTLGLGPFPSWSTGLRVYQSGADADGLGSFVMRAGHVDSDTAWYAAYWRRFWYQDFTGKPSQLPPNLEAIPNQASALAWMKEAVHPLRRLEQRAMHIVGLTKRHPLPVATLQREQALLRQEREQLLPRMMAYSATGPATVAMIRDIHNDDAVDLTMLADRHVQAYRRWQQRIAQTRTLLSAGPVQTEARRCVLPMMPSAV